jgi:SMODS and SLOG-associating 2TM effector domain
MNKAKKKGKRVGIRAMKLLSTLVPFDSAQWSKWLLNIAIGLQVFLGALTTALGASLNGKSVRGIMLRRSVICLTSLLDNGRNFSPWWCINACGVVPGAHAWLK